MREMRLTEWRGAKEEVGGGKRETKESRKKTESETKGNERNNLHSVSRFRTARFPRGPSDAGLLPFSTQQR